MDGAPISLSGVCPLPCLPFGNTASLEIPEACSHSFPTFPYTHAYATAQPFIGSPQKVAHLGKPKVVYPPSDCIGQFLLALLAQILITDSTCEVQDGHDKLNNVKFTWRYADNRPVVYLSASPGIFTSPYNIVFS